MKISKEIDNLYKKVEYFYKIEGILLSLMIPFTLFLFFRYFSLLNNLSISLIILLPIPTYFLYNNFWRKPDFSDILLELDKKLSLEEKLITFWEYKDYEEPYGLIKRLAKSLEERFSNIPIKNYYKWRPSKLFKTIASLMIFLIILNLANSLSTPKSKFTFTEEKKEEEVKIDEKTPSSRLQISKNLKGEKLTEEKRKEEKSNLEGRENKSLEKLLSEWDFDEEKIMEELTKKQSSSGKNEKTDALSQEKTPPPLGNSYTEEKIAKLKEGQQKLVEKNIASETEEDKEMEGSGEFSEGSKREENNTNMQGKINLPLEKSGENKEAQGSLPGTAERKEKLGKEPTPRLNTNPEKVYVPSQGMDESKKKVYLFEAPGLKEDKEKIAKPFSTEYQYKSESSVSPRVIPWDLQEIIKSYFSQ